MFLSVNIRAQHKLTDSYNFPSFPKVPSPYSDLYTVIKQNFSITLRDGIVLDCSKFYPSVSDPYLPNGYPGVIMCHGYGDRKETLEKFANDQAAYGYSVYTYSMRGQGNSGGLSNLISMTEAQDLIEVVNYVKHDKQSGLDTGKVLIMGGSQGGIIPYMAACNGMNVKCIIAALTSPEFASSWIDNGCIKMTLLWSVDYTPDTVRYSSQVDRMSDWIYSSAPDKWDSLARWLPYNRDFKTNISQNKIPILLENNWQDKFFSAYCNMNSTSVVKAPKRYYFGAVAGHGGDTSPAEDQWHMNFFNEWFYYWLFDINNGILTRPLYHFAYTTFPDYYGMWSFTHDSSYVWPPTNMASIKYYFNTGNKLTTSPSTNYNTYVTLNNTVTGGLTMQTAVDEEFTGSTFTSQFKKATITFDTDPLTRNLKMLGTPIISLDYASNVNLCQYNFQMYEVSAKSTKLVTRFNYTDRKYTANTRKFKSINAISHSHIFQKGNKIRIIVTNLDTAPDDVNFLATNPHVLPVLTNGSHKMYLSNNSFLYIPFKADSISGGIAGNMLDTKAGNDNTKNIKFGLTKNFPNPFNPKTVIEYSISQNSFVTLKIYDLTGREIATLVNEQKMPGDYSINFDASTYHISSGIYFYKLVSGKNVDIKKMSVIK